MNRITVHNSRFAKAGVSCFNDIEVLNSSFMRPMKFSPENPRLRTAAKRYWQAALCIEISTILENPRTVSTFTEIYAPKEVTL